MTDYYPLIARAVTGLDKNTGEARRALYERARAALVGQLRSLDPPLTESEITRERLALEEAVRKVEAEAARKLRAEVTRTETVAEQPPVPTSKPEEPPRRTPSRLATPIALRKETAKAAAPAPPPPSAPAAAQAAPVPVAEPPLPKPVREPPPPRPAPRARLQIDRSPLSDTGLKGFRDVIAEAETLGPASAQASKSAREAFAAAPASLPELDRLEPRIDTEELRSPRREPDRAKEQRPAREAKVAKEIAPKEKEPDGQPARPPRPNLFEGIVTPKPPPAPRKAEPEALAPPRREQAARPAEPERALTARREVAPPRPSEAPVARLGRRDAPPLPLDLDTSRPKARREPPPPPPPEPVVLDPPLESLEPMQIEEPRDDAAPAPPPRPEPPPPRKSKGRAFRSRGQRALETEADELGKRSRKGLVAALATVVLIFGLGAVLYMQREKVTAMFGAVKGMAPTAQTDAPTVRPKIADRVGDAPAPRSGAAPANTPAPALGPTVAQRVVLYEEDPADPQGKRYVGSALWRTETVTPGAGLAPELAVRADVEIPERRMAMTLSIRRNTDQTLPASHTVEIMFNLPADFPFGGVGNVPGILMKEAEQARGAPLSGLAVKVTSGFFLIGLSAAESDKQRNLQLLQQRAWFDLPVVYSNGRRAILAIEKGTPGERSFQEAFTTWQK